MDIVSSLCAGCSANLLSRTPLRSVCSAGAKLSRSLTSAVGYVITSTPSNAMDCWKLVLPIVAYIAILYPWILRTSCAPHLISSYSQWEMSLFCSSLSICETVVSSRALCRPKRDCQAFNMYSRWCSCVAFSPLFLVPSALWVSGWNKSRHLLQPTCGFWDKRLLRSS
jgi:hypothetical protein